MSRLELHRKHTPRSSDCQQTVFYFNAQKMTTFGIKNSLTNNFAQISASGNRKDEHSPIVVFDSLFKRFASNALIYTQPKRANPGLGHVSRNFSACRLNFFYFYRITTLYKNFRIMRFKRIMNLSYRFYIPMQIVDAYSRTPRTAELILARLTCRSR